MSYEQFKHRVMVEIRRYLPDDYENWNLEIREVPKVNGYMEGLHLVPEDGTGISPTIYLRDLYGEYQQCESLERVCQKAASVLAIGLDYAACMEEAALLQLPKDRIVYQLVSAEENRRLLENVPHRVTMDLALIYRVMLDADDGGVNSAIISYDLAEILGLTEAELFQLAEVNTPNVLPAKVYYSREDFVILTNNYKIFGATALLYPGVLKSVADGFEADLFILPSSIHEVFLIPVMGQPIADMNRTIIEANNTLIPPEERLAHHVYVYHRKEDCVGIPFEMPNGFDDRLH